MKEIMQVFGVGESITSLNSSDDLSTDIQTILRAIIGALAIVAIVVVIVGGINYMTSGGDQGKVKTARNTILYGAIGLVICALSFAIVNFVIGTILA